MMLLLVLIRIPITYRISAAMLYECSFVLKIILFKKNFSLIYVIPDDLVLSY